MRLVGGILIAFGILGLLPLLLTTLMLRRVTLAGVLDVTSYLLSCAFGTLWLIYGSRVPRLGPRSVGVFSATLFTVALLKSLVEGRITLAFISAFMVSLAILSLTILKEEGEAGGSSVAASALHGKRSLSANSLEWEPRERGRDWRTSSRSRLFPFTH